jgi:hypothetical protein
MLGTDIGMRGFMPCVVFRAEEELDFAASPVPQAGRSTYEAQILTRQFAAISDR